MIILTTTVSQTATARRANNAICAMRHRKRGSQMENKKKKNLALELRRLPHFSSFPTEQPGQNHCQSVSQLGSQPGCRSCSCSSCCVANVDCILGAAAAAKQISAFSV